MKLSLLIKFGDLLLNVVFINVLLARYSHSACKAHCRRRVVVQSRAFNTIESTLPFISLASWVKVDKFQASISTQSHIVELCISQLSHGKNERKST